ncbi:MAG: tRNA (guanosine(46)-N7)-methyltransferase TrmB [Treponema sp.]|nr:tRNA (guanosine(46)-N7)-methyltransferase TrmB [Treponema sp.]
MNEDLKENATELTLRREVKTFVLRAGRMTDAQERAYKELSAKWCIPFYEDKKLDFKEVFGNDNPVVIEIGFGMGDATWQIAKENPETNYLGIEVHRPGVGKLLNHIENEGLSNLRIIEYDALEVLDKMVDDGGVDGFHIFFPDPWPKKKHHKRRMLQRPRTNLIASKLKKSGYLYFVTDWLPYAEFALEELNLTEGLKNRYDGYAEKQPWRSQTKFERKGQAADRVITEIMFEKI